LYDVVSLGENREKKRKKTCEEKNVRRKRAKKKGGRKKCREKIVHLYKRKKCEEMSLKEKLDEIVALERNHDLVIQLKNIYTTLPSEVRKKLKIYTRQMFHQLFDNDPNSIKYVSKQMLLFNLIRYRQASFFKDVPLPYRNYIHYFAKNDEGDKLYLLKFLGISSDQNVYLTYKVRKGEKIDHRTLQHLASQDLEYMSDDNKDRLRVIKWHDTYHMNHEIQGWLKCKEEGIPCPGIDVSYTVMGFPAIAMSLLQDIEYDNEDSYIEMGCQILDILKKFHKFGCHSDIKPDNIMCYRDGDKITYYLIDMAGITMKQMGKGFRRRVWTPNYTSQAKKSDTITTPWHDLIELGFTLNVVYSKCHGMKIRRRDYRRVIDGSVIDRYMELLRSYAGKKTSIDDDVYDELKAILTQDDDTMSVFNVHGFNSGSVEGTKLIDF
jgi:hypothetical protein